MRCPGVDCSDSCWWRPTQCAEATVSNVWCPHRYEASAPTRARQECWDQTPGQLCGPGKNDPSYQQQDLTFVQQLSSYYCPRSGLIGMSFNNEPTVRHTAVAQIPLHCAAGITAVCIYACPSTRLEHRGWTDIHGLSTLRAEIR